MNVNSDKIKESMADIAKDAFLNRNYGLAAEMYERCLKDRGHHQSFEIYFGYGDSLAKSGRIREALDVYSQCYRLGNVSHDRLKHLASALLEIVGGDPTVSSNRNNQQMENSFLCLICEGVLLQPVTTVCGHTFCRRCLLSDTSKACRKCGQRFVGSNLENIETNILIKGLVEKWWSSEVEAAKIREEGNDFLQRNEVEAALAKFNEAALFGEYCLHLF